ncbi:MAG: HK97 family phage prohead protease [Bacteroidales bacterium]
MAYKFLISDESINSYGTRILSSGIHTDNYEKNPIILWNHTRGWSDKEDQILPIGQCTKIWKDGENCFAEIELDPTDAFAQKIEKKVAQGILRACSVSLEVISTSEDPKYLIQGQTRPTVIESALREISIVDIPSNKNCVKLYDQNKEINFSDNEPDNFLLPLLNIKNMNFKEDVQNLLALKEASEERILESLQEVILQNKQALKLKEDLKQANEKLAAFELQEKEAHTAKIIALVEEAITAKKILASQKEMYTALAEKDFESTQKVLNSLSPMEDISKASEDTQVDPWEACFNEINKNKKN